MKGRGSAQAEPFLFNPVVLITLMVSAYFFYY
jgi:hypothetical protein